MKVDDKTNIITISGRSGVGKSSLSNILSKKLNECGYTVSVVEGRFPNKKDKVSDFVILIKTKGLGSINKPKVIFNLEEGMMDFINALNGIKKIGKVGQLKT